MDLRRLEYFVATARHGSVTRAAQELHLTQPALSQQLQRLEASLGLTLLRRLPRGVELTPAGADLLTRAEALLAAAAEVRAAMDEHAGSARGLARVAATAAELPRLPAALAAFHHEHPGIRLALRQGSAGEVVELTRRGAVDVAVLAVAEPPPNVEATVIADEPLVVLAPPGDPPAGLRPVGPAALRDRPLILAERGTALREVVLGACQAHGFSPVPLVEVGDPATVLALVEAGVGHSVVPASWAPGAPFDHPGARHRVALLRPDGAATPAGRLLHEHLRAALGSEDLGEL